MNRLLIPLPGEFRRDPSVINCYLLLVHCDPNDNLPSVSRTSSSTTSNMGTTLKEALYDNLLGTMSDNTARRNQAEQQIKLLEVVNGRF